MTNPFIRLLAGYVLRGTMTNSEKNHTTDNAIDNEWHDTMRTHKYVADRIEPSRRRQNLSWDHHREVASLPPNEQDFFLDQAEKQGWTPDELRAAVEAGRGVIEESDNSESRG